MGLAVLNSREVRVEVASMRYKCELALDHL